jgi:tripartite-type tricarboxylate transporter receptor subunit TctC
MWSKNCDKQLNHDSKRAATPRCYGSGLTACTLARLLYGMEDAIRLKRRSAMRIKRVSTIAAATICLAAAVATVAPVRADDYPSRPITMVVPLAPGGSTDTLGRIIAQGMRPTLGQPVVVENTAGAAGTIGVTRAARDAPDGYTVLWGMWGTNVANGAIYSLDFDLLNDFAPVALVATQPFLIDARKTMPANNLKELVAWLKAKGDKATMGTSGVGSPSHVAGVLMEQLVGVKWQMISYRSAGLATQDLLAGITDLQLDTPAVSLTHVRSGDLKAYAVTAKSRIAVAPDIPTTDEAGLPGFYFSFWHAMWAPKGTPKPIIAKLNAAIVAALADPDTRKKLVDLAQEIYPREQQTPEALYAFQKGEVDKWWPIIKAAGIKAE